MSSFRRIVLAVLTASIAVTLSSPAAAIAHVYDAPTLARVDVHDIGAAAASPSQIIDAQEWSASPPPPARGTPTTSYARYNATNSLTRSLDDVASLRGATIAEVERLIPSDWVKAPTSASTGGLGIRYSNPDRLGEQIRIMPGKITDPNPVKRGPYMRISRNGPVTDPIPLSGNPTL